MKVNITKKQALAFLRRYIIITLGNIIFAFSISFFLDIYELSGGGATGVALTINALFPSISTGIASMMINFPILIFGFFAVGWRFTLSTAYSVVVHSIFIDLFDMLRGDYVITSSPILAAIFGGILFGLGFGIVFRCQSSTGGVDPIIKYLRTKFRHLRTSEIGVAVDLVIIIGSTLIRFFVQDFPLERGLYSLLVMAISMLAFDVILYGGHTAKMVYIITEGEPSAEILKGILHDLGIGATYVNGVGAYSGKEKKVILCACKQMQFPKLKDIVSQTDPKAFMIVSSSKEIYGENFIEHNSEEL